MPHVETKLRAQPRLDLKWLKTDLSGIFRSQDDLSCLWNNLINDGELTGPFSDGLLNSAGVTARKGEQGKYYCGLRVTREEKLLELYSYVEFLGSDLYLLW